MELSSALPPPAPPRAADGSSADLRARANGSAAATTATIGAALLAGRTVGVHLPPCPFLHLTGVPCPFCGLTRLADALAHVHVGDALATSPAGVVLLVGVAALATAFVAAAIRHRPPPWLGSRAVLPAILVLVGLHWATSIAFGLPS
ncbi:MAG: DUF2752 domain-containing protein [Acidimicrobiales bacterium]